MRVYILSYDFHIITIQGTESSVERRVEVFFDDIKLIDRYRHLKEVLAYGWIHPNDNFKLYIGVTEEADISRLDSPLV